jgi:CheY-like chemotaxis protein
MTKNNIDLQEQLISNLPSTNEKTKNLVVLIVEADLVKQMTIKKFIENKFATIITGSSDNVIRILKVIKIDVILTDIAILGKMNGLELTTVLKKSSEFSHIPIIVVTANACEIDKYKALRAGCNNYLANPFSKKSLIDMIDVSIGQLK